MTRNKIPATIAGLAFAAGLIFVAGCSRSGPGDPAAAVDRRSEAAEADGKSFRGGRGRQSGLKPGGPAADHGPGPGGGARRERSLTSLRLSAEETRALEISTVRAAFRPMTDDLRLMGKLYAHQFRKAIISYPFPARIARIHVLPGQAVKPGQELVTLQSEAVGEAKSEFFKSRADLQLARSNHEREQRLFDRGAGAGKNLQSAEAALRVAEANLEAAEKKLHVLGFTEAQVKAAADEHGINPFITLFAPILGKVAANNAVLGGMVDQGTEILTVLDPSVLCADGEVFERDIARVRPGQEVEVTVPAYAGLVFTGKVQYIGDFFNEDTRTVTVRAEVDNREGKLKPGMFASLRIVLNRDERAVVIPERAVLDDGDEKIVFVRAGEEFFLRRVALGPRLDGLIAIAAGLDEGDEVVTDGAFQLKSKLDDATLKRAGVH